MGLRDVERHVQINFNGVAFGVCKVHRQGIAVVQGQQLACSQCQGFVADIPQGLDRRHRKGQLHHRAESGLRGTAASDHQLMVLVRTGAQEDQGGFESFTDAAVRFQQSKNSFVKVHHFVDIRHVDPEMRGRWVADFQHACLQEVVVVCQSKALLGLQGKGRQHVGLGAANVLCK